MDIEQQLAVAVGRAEFSPPSPPDGTGVLFVQQLDLGNADHREIAWWLMEHGYGGELSWGS